MSTYKTLHEFGMDEIIIEKSTFIGYAKPIKTEEEAIEFVNEIKKKNKRLFFLFCAKKIPFATNWSQSCF